MATRRIALADSFDAAVDAAAKAVSLGEAVIFPTETVYGIGVDSGNAAAVAMLRRLKGRDGDKPFQLLIADADMGRAMGGLFSPGAERLAGAVWPGPLTLVVPAAGGDETLGLRVPDDRFVRALVRRVGRALATSSANPAGAAPPTDADAAEAVSLNAALLVDGGPCRVGRASTVVLSQPDGSFAILREGALGREEVARLWG